MKITTNEQLNIQRCIIKATEKGVGIAKVAEHCKVSKSTVYKYRRLLVERGFLIKESDGIYSVADNKYSNKPSTHPKIHTLDLSITDDIPEKEKEETIVNDNTANNVVEILETVENVSAPKSIEIKEESYLPPAHQQAETVIKVKNNSKKSHSNTNITKNKKGLIKKIFNKVKKAK